MAVRRPRWPILFLALVVILAAVLRFWRLDEIPPGLYHDEAYYGLDALSLRNGATFPQYYEGWELYAADAHAGRPAKPGRFPVFFEGNYGREPLHVYLIALSLRVFGVTSTAIRAVSAAAGTVAILTTWLAARALFRPDENRPFAGELLPLLAAFTLAVLYPALHFSRFGIRAMTLLPLVTLAVFAFWRGWHARSHGWLVISGIFVGLSLYTFAAARLFPLVFVVFGAYLLVLDRASLVARWRGLLMATGAALLVAAPLLLFFARYPYFFVFRMAYVANRGTGTVEGAPALTWMYNVGRVLGGLFWQGETHLRHNLPGRPYMDIIQATLFAFGFIRGLRFRRRPEYAFLLIWLGVMLLPSILSGDAPHFGRLTGAAPAIALLVAAGGTWLVETLSKVTSKRWVAPACIIVLCGGSLFLTVRDYFVRYAAHPDLARDFYQDDWDLGRYAASLPHDSTLYLTPSQEEMATIYFALEGADRLRSFNGADGLIPAGIPGRPSTYLIRPSAATTQEKLQSYFPDGELGETGQGFVPFQVPADAPRIRTEFTADFDFGDLIHLVGYEIAKGDKSLLVTLTWQAAGAPPLDYTGFVHLVGPDGTLVAQLDRPPAGYPTSDWRPGEIVVDHFRVDLPPDLPAGDYRLQTGFYDPATVTRLGDPAGLGEVSLP